MFFQSAYIFIGQYLLVFEREVRHLRHQTVEFAVGGGVALLDLSAQVVVFRFRILGFVAIEKTFERGFRHRVVGDNGAGGH